MEKMDDKNLSCAISLMRYDIEHGEQIDSKSSNNADVANEVKKSQRISRKRPSQDKLTFEDDDQLNNVKKRKGIVKKPQFSKCEPEKPSVISQEILKKTKGRVSTATKCTAEHNYTKTDLSKLPNTQLSLDKNIDINDTDPLKGLSKSKSKMPSKSITPNKNKPVTNNVVKETSDIHKGSENSVLVRKRGRPSTKKINLPKTTVFDVHSKNENEVEEQNIKKLAAIVEKLSTDHKLELSSKEQDDSISTLKRNNKPPKIKKKWSDEWSGCKISVNTPISETNVNDSSVSKLSFDNCDTLMKKMVKSYKSNVFGNEKLTEEMTEKLCSKTDNSLLTNSSEVYKSNTDVLVEKVPCLKSLDETLTANNISPKDSSVAINVDTETTNDKAKTHDLCNLDLKNPAETSLVTEKSTVISNSVMSNSNYKPSQMEVQDSVSDSSSFNPVVGSESSEISYGIAIITEAISLQCKEANLNNSLKEMNKTKSPDKILTESNEMKSSQKIETNKTKFSKTKSNQLSKTKSTPKTSIEIMKTNSASKSSTEINETKCAKKNSMKTNLTETNEMKSTQKNTTEKNETKPAQKNKKIKNHLTEINETKFTQKNTTEKNETKFAKKSPVKTNLTEIYETKSTTKINEIKPTQKNETKSIQKITIEVNETKPNLTEIYETKSTPKNSTKINEIKSTQKNETKSTQKIATEKNEETISAPKNSAEINDTESTPKNSTKISETKSAQKNMNKLNEIKLIQKNETKSTQKITTEINEKTIPAPKNSTEINEIKPTQESLTELNVSKPTQKNVIKKYENKSTPKNSTELRTIKSIQISSTELNTLKFTQSDFTEINEIIKSHLKKKSNTVRTKLPSTVATTHSFQKTVPTEETEDNSLKLSNWPCKTNPRLNIDDQLEPLSKRFNVSIDALKKTVIDDPLASLLEYSKDITPDMLIVAPISKSPENAAIFNTVRTMKSLNAKYKIETMRESKVYEINNLKDLMLELSKTMPSWNLSIVNNPSRYVISHITINKFGVPVADKSIVLDRYFRASVYVHQTLMYKYCRPYRTGTEIVNLIKELSTLK